MTTARYEDVGNGMQIDFGTTGFNAAVIDVDGPGFVRPSIETTTMATTVAKEYIPGDLYDPGDIDIEFAHDPSIVPPIDQPREVITITWPKHSGINNAATWVGSGFLTEYKASGKLDTRMTAKAKIKLSGKVTFNAAS